MYKRQLVKRIPVCAGMGGGSSDGAAVLRALNRHFGHVFTGTELEGLGARLGSDVPFCVYGGTDFCTGRGEKLTVLKPMPDCHMLICKPRFAVSTQELFSKIDCRRIKCRPATKGMLSAIAVSYTHLDVYKRQVLQNAYAKTIRSV